MNDEHVMDADEPVYVISIAARIVGVHQQTLRMYERQGLVQPKRTSNRRLYSRRTSSGCGRSSGWSRTWA